MFVKRASARYVEDSALQKGDMNVALHDKPISDIMRLIKGKSAFEANKILNRTGKFWQHESFDHVVRDEKELLRRLRK